MAGRQETQAFSGPRFPFQLNEEKGEPSQTSHRKPHVRYFIKIRQLFIVGTFCFS